MATLPFTYHRPATLAEACALGQALAGDAAFLAGGTELVPDYRRGRETATHLIALGRIAELRGIVREGDTLRIGALTTVGAIAASPDVRAWLPALAEAARALGSPQIRSLATIGGNFCRAVSCADLPPAALVGGARLRIVSGAGERTISADALFAGPRKTVLGPGEVLAEILIPAAAPHTGTSFERFAQRRGMALAVASAAASLVLDGERIARAAVALGAVGPVPFLVTPIPGLLQGEVATDALFAVAGALCADAARPISDIRGSDVFRRDLVVVLVRRALARALTRARGAGAVS
ncbi:MAG TPA: xanthine dehydrogenase family protein subunit M [Gemmatimonadaceae bacterium]|nr:xanthine dehydrogenase family protein subunit M [Gemmatimonadaceae bacterium]